MLKPLRPVIPAVLALLVALIACAIQPPSTPPLTPLATAATATAAPTLTSTPNASGEITVAEVLNDVTARGSEAELFGPAGVGYTLGVGGEAKTGDDSRARLDFADGAIVRLAPNSSFAVRAIAPSETGNVLTRLRLAFGKLWISLTGGVLDVETPVGVASVRGSFAIITYELRDPVSSNDDILIIDCLEGDCSVLGLIDVDEHFGDLERIIVTGAGQVTRARLTGDVVQEFLKENPESTRIVLTLTAAAITPTATPTETPTPSRTPTITATRTRTPRPPSTNTKPPATFTKTITPTPTRTFTSTASRTSTPSRTPTAINTATATPTRTATPVATNTSTPTGTNTGTPTPTGTATSTPTITDTPTSTATSTPTSTSTPAPVIINVNTTTDELNTDGDCSLREAIRAANTNLAVDACPAGSSILVDTINISAGTYTLSIAGAGEEAALTGDLDITEAVDIVGTGNPVVDGGGVDRVFHLITNVNMQISGLTIQGGNVSGGFGGGILLNIGSMTLNDVVLKNNQAQDGGGIAAFAGSTLTLTDVTVESNQTSSRGGGVYNDGTATLDQSAIISNTIVAGTALGGGLYNNGMANVTMTNVTLSGNSASGTTAQGGGLYNAGTITVTNATIFNNAANSAGSGVFGAGGVTTVMNSIVAFNTGSNNCGGGITPGGNNLYDLDGSCPLAGGEVIIPSVDFDTAIVNNGGFTPTHKLFMGSAARDVGNNAFCPAADQRGSGFPRSDGLCDIGAYEFP